MSEARVRVSLTDGVLEFEGQETFVAGLVEKFAAVIHSALAGESPDANDAAGSRDVNENPADAASAAATDVPSAAPSPTVPLDDVFAATETGVQILRALPGTSRALRTVNLAKLYLYGLRMLKQRETALFAEIARVCKGHGCYDASNMATYLKSHQTSFVFGGKGKRQTIKLTAPGIKGTEALIARLRARSNGIDSRSKGIALDAVTSSRPATESTGNHYPTPPRAGR